MLASVSAPAQAACPQALGLYNEAESGAEIAFAGPLGEADGMQHRFSLVFGENGVKMDGVVMMAGEPDRPWGVILHNCPQGDATGAEIDACTVWEGALYVVDGKGGTKWMPVLEPGSIAGESLLLPDFGAAVMRSAAWRDGQITKTPGDVFRLTGCQE
ncbi:hypothetical protein [Hoeflea sp.]|uniref:hypothetical protein n=1 Tax=Hoeflea sp. TaxID=1940281 RepID=UPI0019CCF1A1|nr:hypothetical protein [Hoeflea sp.]MBC7280847.1 hypothetical protein [Hoeflea sp.]